MSEWRHGVCNNIDFSTQQNIWTFIYCLAQWFSNILHNRQNLHICTLASLPSELPLVFLLTVLLVKQHHLHIYKYFFIIFPSLPCPTFSHSLTHNPTVSCILRHSFELSRRPYNLLQSFPFLFPLLCVLVWPDGLAPHTRFVRRQIRIIRVLVGK